MLRSKKVYDMYVHSTGSMVSGKMRALIIAPVFVNRTRNTYPGDEVADLDGNAERHVYLLRVTR